MDTRANAKTKPRMSVWPAVFDMLQSATGVVLALFLAVHMCLEASILISNDAMYFVARMFEAEPLLGKPYPILVSLIAIAILLLIAVHAFFAMRKIPASYKKIDHLQAHVKRYPHNDTRLWLFQVVSGFLLFFIVGVHLYQVIMHPADIGPFVSSDRVWSGGMWLLYLLLLLIAIPHAVIGVYRLAFKWGLLDAKQSRPRMTRAVWVVTTLFVTLSLFTLARYMSIGAGHADRVGERYRPAHLSQPPNED